MSTFATFWLVGGGILILLELVIPGAILGFLGLSSCVVGGLLHYGVVDGFINTGMAFFVTSLFMVLVVRTFFLRLMPGDTQVQNTNEDKDAEGSIVEVSDEIFPESKGRIRFRETTWEAQSEAHLKPGEKAIIVSRQGNIWTVKPL